MANIVKTSEMHLGQLGFVAKTHAPPVEEFDDERLRAAISASAMDTATRARARGILVFSTTGEMAREVSKGRPLCPIVAFTQTADVARMMTLFYAVYPVVVPLGKYTDPTVSSAESAVLQRGLAGLQRGDRVILCSGALPALPGLVQSIRCAHVCLSCALSF